MKKIGYAWNMTLHKSADVKSSLGFVVVVVLIASLGGLLFRYDTGVIAGANGFLKTEFQVAAAITGLVSSSIDLGAMVGLLLNLLSYGLRHSLRRAKEQ